MGGRCPNAAYASIEACPGMYMPWAFDMEHLANRNQASMMESDARSREQQANRVDNWLVRPLRPAHAHKLMSIPSDMDH